MKCPFLVTELGLEKGPFVQQAQVLSSVKKMRKCVCNEDHRVEVREFLQKSFISYTSLVSVSID